MIDTFNLLNEAKQKLQEIADKQEQSRVYFEKRKKEENLREHISQRLNRQIVFENLGLDREEKMENILQFLSQQKEANSAFFSTVLGDRKETETQTDLSMAELSSKMNYLEEKLAHTKSRKKQLKIEQRSQKATIAQNISRISELNQKIIDLEEKNTALTAELKEKKALEEKIDSLSSEIEYKDGKIAEIEAKLKQSKEDFFKICKLKLTRNPVKKTVNEYKLTSIAARVAEFLSIKEIYLFKSTCSEIRNVLAKNDSCLKREIELLKGKQPEIKEKENKLEPKSYRKDIE